MDQLVSMLVPLETLEGWPEAPAVPWLSQFGLFLGWPFIGTVAIVVYVVITQKRERRLARESGAVEPEWLGGGEDHGPVLESGVEPATSNKPTANKPTDRRAATATAEEDRPGGASARW